MSQCQISSLHKKHSKPSWCDVRICCQSTRLLNKFKSSETPLRFISLSPPPLCSPAFFLPPPTKLSCHSHTNAVHLPIFYVYLSAPPPPLLPLTEPVLRWSRAPLRRLISAIRRSLLKPGGMFQGASRSSAFRCGLLLNLLQSPWHSHNLGPESLN